MRAKKKIIVISRIGMKEKMWMRSSLGNNDKREKGPSAPNPYLYIIKWQ